jgi:AraC-like DNA-binding protein
MLTPEMRDVLTQRAGLAGEFGPLFSLLEETPPALVRISELADASGMTPGALSKRFQRRFGTTLKEFISGRILQQARQLLAGGTFPVAEAARQLGYRDPHYFHRFFLKHVGCTPQEFRKRGNHD